ncbi:hypothetical protein [Leeuwenhoekiella sp. NPDC079379]|uniref:hypothetical protein n=1 Tax=Leeuwenhoekiella sp. NPDC079379 TaxID=3364122 RepID=UPI0037C795E1
MKNLSDLFAAEFVKKTQVKPEFTFNKKISNLRTSVEQSTKPQLIDTVKTILQLNAVPFAIDISQYKNAHSPDNPTGDYKAAYRLSRLADSVPIVTTYYTPSLNSTEKIWENLIYGASTNAKYTNHLLSKAQQNCDTSKLVDMGGGLSGWLPVYTKPSNWYTLLDDEANLIDMEIDMVNGDTSNSDFLIVRGDKAISLDIIKQDSTQKITFHKETQIKKINLKVLCVEFIRPWLDFELFSLKNWKIEGLNSGYYSTGTLTNNQGIFPLVTQSMLIGTKINLEGTFNKNDLELIKSQITKKNHFSIGPFFLNTNNQKATINEVGYTTQIKSSLTQVIGYISNVVPTAPSI